MADSLRASAVGLNLVDQARRQRRWNKTASAWYQQAFTSRSTLNRFWAGQGIRSEAFMALCDVVGVPWQQVADLEEHSLASDDLSNLGMNPRSQWDWGEAPDSQIFYGRQEELATLSDWVTSGAYRLLLIRGMGGMGKTMLTARLVRKLQEESAIQWDWMVWRSLRNAPPLPQLLDDILQKLDPLQQGHTVQNASLRLLDLMRNQRGLLILDNLETILLSQPSTQTLGQGIHYGPGYADYGELFRLIGESAHQSCLILTSRELPQRLANHLGPQPPMRCFPLAGLEADTIPTLFQDKGHFVGASQDWQRLHRHYAGNPLALKIVATAVRDFFEGNVSDFLTDLNEDAVLFSDIEDLLGRQFERLSPAEQTVMYWLAIHREPASLPNLQRDIFHLKKRDILASLSLLQHRSLIEKKESTFTQQPVVMEYVLAQLVENVTQSLLQPEKASSLLQNCALAKAQTKDYVYQTQVKLILEPICDRVSQSLEPAEWLNHAHRLVTQWQQHPHTAAYGPGNLINLLRAGQFSLQDFDFSGLPIWQANLQGLTLRNVSLAHADVSGSVFTEMIGNVLSAAFSCDGMILGTSDNGYCIRLWDVQTGQLLNICKGHQHWIRSVCFSPPQDTAAPMLLASGSADRTIRIWDVQTGAETLALRGHTDEVFAVSFCPWGEKLLSASGDRTIRLWDLNTGDCVGLFKGHEDRVRTVTVACGVGTKLASGDELGCLRIWDFLTEACCHSIAAHDGWVRAVAFIADGTILASGGNDGMVRLWNVETGKLIQEWLGHTGGVYTLSYAEAEKLLATGGADHEIRLWDLSDAASCLNTISGHGNQIYSVLFSPNHQLLAAVSLDQTVKLWDWQQNRCLKTWRGYTDWGFPVDVSPDGQLLVSGSGANTLHIWDTESQACLRSLPGYPTLVRAVVMMPHQQLVVAGADPVIQIWDWQAQYCIKQLHGHRDWVLNLAMIEAEDGLHLASCSADQSIRLWKVKTGREEQILLGHQDHVNAIAFCPLPEQSNLLASGSSDQQIKLWNWQTGECLQTFEGHRHRIYGLCFHPTKPLLFSAGGDLTIRGWDLESGNCIQTWNAHEGWIFAIAISPCGQYLLSGGQDQVIKLWDLESGDCIRSFTGHRHQVYSIVFEPQGGWFASGSQDQTIRIWDIESGDCLHQLSARLYEGLNITGTKGLSMAQRSTLEELGAISF